MFCDKNRKTITKTRVIAGGRATVSQQVVRIDRECNEVISEIYEKELNELHSNGHDHRCKV